MTHKKMSAVLFLIGLILGLFSLILLPKKTFSENENRFLEEMPTVSMNNIFNRERRFMNGFEAYVSDHFSHREFWISIKTNLELLSGKKESNGVFILEHALIKKIEKIDFSLIDTNIEAIRSFNQVVNKPFYLLLVPTAAEIYNNLLPENVDVINQKELTEYCFEALSDQVVCLDSITPLEKAKDEYIYYRTDHHWTSLGAYRAYEGFASQMGYGAVPLENLVIEEANSEFLGTLYSKTLYNQVEKDSIEFYYPIKSVVSQVIIQSGNKETEYPSLYFREFLTKKDKYAAFLGSNQPILTIKTNNSEGQKLLLFKDSYAHTMTQFLSLHYREIVLVDLRYINKPINEVLDLDSFDQIMFLYNVENFITDENIIKLGQVK